VKRPDLEPVRFGLVHFIRLEPNEIGLLLDFAHPFKKRTAVPSLRMLRLAGGKNWLDRAIRSIVS
jgi:hypothetical protein